MSARRAYWLAFAACAAAATIPLLLTAVLPMADLPQHMAQVAIWKHFDDPCYRFGETYELNFATPYLLGYLVTRAFATVFTVTVAVKITVWLAVIATPLAIRMLLLRGGGDALWLSLLGFPLAYGYAFWWGFLNFWVVIPLGLFYIALLYGERVNAFVGMLLALLLMTGHALVFAFCAGVAVAVGVVRRAPVLILSTIPGALLFVLFFLRLRSTESAAHGEIEWKLSAERLTEFSSRLVANAWEPAGLALVAAVAIAIVLARPSVTRDRARWIFAAVAAVTYFMVPFGAFGTAYIYSRFAVMLAVAILFLMDGPRRRPGFTRAIIVTAVVVWMSVLAFRFQRFGAEVRDFERAAESIPSNRRIAQFNVVPFSDDVPGPVFWHFGALYQVRKGGVSAWSFAANYPQIVRYRPGAEPPVRTRSTPVDGIDWSGVLQYDYLLVRGPDPRRWLFRHAPVAIPLHARSGQWWVFATPRAGRPQNSCPPLVE